MKRFWLEEQDRWFCRSSVTMALPGVPRLAYYLLVIALFIHFVPSSCTAGEVRSRWCIAFCLLVLLVSGVVSRVGFDVGPAGAGCLLDPVRCVRGFVHTCCSFECMCKENLRSGFVVGNCYGVGIILMFNH